MRLCAALVLIATVAHADTRLGDGLALQIADRTLYVTRGGQRARLAQANVLESMTLGKRTVDVDVGDDTCISTSHYTWTFDQLAAKLDNVAAFALHRRHDDAHAAAGFARAAQLDPSWPIPAYNLASADQLRGDLDGAIQALAPWLASAPLTTYVQVATDPELRPLLARPELAAIRSGTRGTAKVTGAGITGDIVYAPDRKWIAVARTEGSWGAACFDATDVEIFDATTGRRIATTPLVALDETQGDCTAMPASRVERARVVESLLDDLGFSPTAVEHGTSPTPGIKGTSSFAAAKLGVVSNDGSIGVFRKDHELGRATGLRTMTNTWFVAAANAVVVASIRPGAEGCESTDPTEIDVVTLK